VTRAVDRVDGVPVAHRETVIPPRLVVRGTTGPPVRSISRGAIPREADRQAGKRL
jgi:hypothetical protein